MRRRWTRALAASMVALSALATGPALGAEQPAFDQATFADQDAAPMRVTAPVQMTKERKTPVRAFSGPASMLVHPDNPRIIVAATVDLRTKVCELIRTTDGGSTWDFSESVPHPESYPLCMDNSAGKPAAAIAWGRDGTLYYSAQAYGEGEGGFRVGHVSQILARTTDLGDTWQTVLVENNRGKPDPAPATFGAAVAVDTSGSSDVVYVGYNVHYTGAPEDSPLGHGEMKVAVSTDGGKTFSPGVDLNTFSEVTHKVGGRSYPLIMEGSFGGPSLIARDGAVMAVSGAQFPTGEVPEDEGVFSASFALPLPQLIARSTDQGKSWSFSKLGPAKFSGAGSQTGLGWTPEGGPEGTYLAAYQATPQGASSSGPAQIVVQRSTDDGVNWTEPLAINDDDPADQYASFYPQMGVTPNGRVDVVWQDNRNLTDFLTNVRYTYSMDGGETWAPNILVSDQPVDFNLGVSFNSDLRHPPGVASTNEYAWMGWADPREADELTQTQENFGAAVQFAALPAATSAVLPPVVAAVSAGLLVAGIVLLVLFMRRRRRPSPAPSPAEEPQPAGRV
ncbi:MAG TPA: sialidase family protein [Nitriliruptorales bacterium]|nr:sialidase family protein [Nitriliruptorales bacterium]